MASPARSSRPLESRTALLLLAVALLSFFVFPGHTFLESDSQIFMPILLHRADPSLYSQEILVERPHTAFTLYDELVHGLYRVTGLRHELILYTLQIFSRFAGALGIFWLLTALALEPPFALLGTAIYGLGATVSGPAVLTIEYEPVPRAFAPPLVLLGLGFLSRRQYVAGGLAGSAAFLLHAPTSAAFWAVYLIGLFLPSGAPERKSRLWGLAPLPAAAVFLLLSAGLSAGTGEAQDFFARIDPAWEKLQRLRARYVFPTEWPKALFWIYGCVLLLLASAYARLREYAPAILRVYLWMLPAIGLLSLPLSYLLLEQLKWSLLPQVQLPRYVLYLVLFGILLGYAVGVERIWRANRHTEGLLWFLVAFLLIFQPYHLLWVTPLPLGLRFLGGGGRDGPVWPPWGWAAPAVGIAMSLAILAWKPFGFVAWRTGNARQLAVSGLLSLVLALFTGFCRRKPSLAQAGAAALVLLLFFAAPLSGRRSSRNVATPELLELSAWAQAQTPRDAVFLFPDAGQGLEPGVFRYYARRTILVDWKVGGQVNFFQGFSQVWWQRWQAAMTEPFRPDKMDQYRQLGIDYLVFKQLPAMPSGAVVFRSSKYAIVSVKAR